MEIFIVEQKKRQEYMYKNNLTSNYVYIGISNTYISIILQYILLLVQYNNVINNMILCFPISEKLNFVNNVRTRILAISMQN